MTIIGIDLGTTNSLVSVFLNNECVIIPNALGNRLTPSVVGVMDDGAVIIGEAAKERLISHPNLTEAVFKRHMGSKKQYKLGEKLFSPTDLSALLLKALKADAEAFLGTTITEAVISVPAYFNDHQRRATKEAGLLAGLKVERLINEPTAAALAYGIHQANEEKQLLIFDLGGGTFDVSLLEMSDNVMEIRAVAGDNFLGGEDFDEAILHYFLEQHSLKLEVVKGKWYSMLKKQAESCKVMLTTEDQAEMSFVYNGHTYKTMFTSTDFETISTELLTRLKVPLKKALNDSGIQPKELDHVVLVGGSTQMPIIRSFVARLFGQLPLSHINPDEVVGIGAGIYAAMKERNEYLRESVLTDVCPYTLGIGVVNDVYAPIIERNSVIPCSRVQRFINAKDYQDVIEVDIYQGESRDVKENLKLGSVLVPIPRVKSGEAVIDVRFTYDINGLLEVDIYSHSTGETKSLVIQNNEIHLSEAEITIRLQELAMLKIHPRDDARNQLLLARAGRLYEEALSESREHISQEMGRFERALDTQDPEKIRKASVKLSQFIDQLEAQGLW